MLAGLTDRITDHEFRISSSGSFDAISGGWSGRLTSYYLDNIFAITEGFDMYNSTNGTNSTFNLDIADLGISETEVKSGTSLASQLFFKDLQLFVETSSSFRFVIGEIEWYINGALEKSYGPFTIDVAFYPSCAAAIPIIGIPPHIQPGSGFGPEFSDGCTGGTPIALQEDSGEGLTVGGWRIMRDGDWYAPPITLPTDPSGDVYGTDCYNVAVKSYGYQSLNGVTTVKRGHSGSAYCWPDHLRELIKINPDYLSLVWRQKFPGFARRTSSVVGSYNCAGDGTPVTTIVDDYIYPETEELLAAVGDGSATIEAEIIRSCPAPYFLTSTETIYTTTGWTQTNEAENLGPTHTSFASVPSWLSHPDWRGTFWNTWFNPFGNYTLWFPPDASDSSIRWDLLGSDSDIDYWYENRQQHMTHPDLPGGEDSQKRVNVRTEPITQNGLAGFYNTMTGMPCPWGIRNVDVETEEFPTEFTTDDTSADRFHFLDGASPGTGSVTTDVELTTGDAIEFDMMSFSVFPYMVTSLADRLEINWSDANIASIDAFAVGSDGSQKRIGSGPITSGTTYRIPFGDSEKWATSAAENHGSGTYITDTYDSIETANDESLATIADELRVSSFGLLPGFSPVKIRLEITKVSSGSPATIDHPTFYMAPWDEADVFQENGCISVVLFKDGPAVRYGALEYFDWLADAILDEPVVRPMYFNPSIGDLWCWQNQFLRGLPAQDGLLTRLEAEFVEGEEFPSGNTKHLWRYVDEDDNQYPDSHSGICPSEIGPRMWYLSSWRNMQPFAIFPDLKRESSSGWAKSGGNGLWNYSDIESKHPVIVPGNTAPHLLDPDDNDVLTDAASPTGWTVRTHSQVVDNNEGYDWKLVWNSIEYFKMRPWRGCLSILAPLPTGAANLSYDVDYGSVLHIMAIVDADGFVVIRVAGNNLEWTPTTTAIESQWVCIRIDKDSPGQTVLLVVEDAGDVKLYESVDRGASFTLSDTIASGSKPIVLIGRNGMRQLYWHDSGDVKGEIRDRNNTVIESTFTIVSGVDDVGIAADEDVTEGGQKRVVLHTVEGGVITQRTSPDGKNFS